MYLWAMTLPCNWVLQIGAENWISTIGTASLKGRQSGLLPLPAWIEENLWQGFYVGTDLLAEVNPERGFALSANDSTRIPQTLPLLAPSIFHNIVIAIFLTIISG